MVFNKLSCLMLLLDEKQGQMGVSMIHFFWVGEVLGFGVKFLKLVGILFSCNRKLLVELNS